MVALLQSMQSQLERERQKHILEEQKAEAARRAIEEQERERIRAEKRAAKERRREEARAKEMETRKRNGNNGAGPGLGSGDHGNGGSMHEMEKPRDGVARNGGAATAAATDGDRRGGGGWCWSLFMFLLGVFFVAVASGVSLLWIYTGGHLDQRNIERALPVIRLGGYCVKR